MLEGMVLRALQARGIWMTVLEIAAELDMHPWSISPRMKPLYRKGLVEKSKKLGLNTAGRTRMMLAWRLNRMGL